MTCTILRHNIPFPAGLCHRAGGGTVCCRLASPHTIRIVSSKPEHWVRRTWPDETGPIEVELLYRLEESGWVLVELRLSTYPEFATHSIDTAILRRLPLGRIARLDLKRFTDAEELRDDPWVHMPERVAGLIRDRLVELKDAYGERPGPRSLSFDHFAKLAARYEAAARSGLTPTEQVSEWASITRAAAEKQILRARELGFLPAPRVGRQMAWVDEDSEDAFSSAGAWFRWAENHAHEERELWERPHDE